MQIDPNVGKTQPNPRGVYEYHRIIQYLQAKYGFNAYNYLVVGDVNPNDHYKIWCAKNNVAYPAACLADDHANIRRYDADPEGSDACPEVRNFWHWMLSLISPPAQGGLKIPKTFVLDVDQILKSYDSEVAPTQTAQQLLAITGLASVMHLIPEEFHKTLKKQTAVKDNTLPPFVRTILGYIRDEFGPKLKINFNKDY